MQINPIETLSGIYLEIIDAQRKLKEIEQLEHFKTFLTEGEQGSIRAIISQLQTKALFTQQVTQQIEETQ